MTPNRTVPALLASTHRHAKFVGLCSSGYKQTATSHFVHPPLLVRTRGPFNAIFVLTGSLAQVIMNARRAILMLPDIVRQTDCVLRNHLTVLLQVGRP